jgi:uncharacterized protein
VNRSTATLDRTGAKYIFASGFFLLLVMAILFMPRQTVENFSTIFISIVLEALPFVMIGVIISSLIQLFVSEEMISRIIPRNLFAGLIVASLMGFVFPICECANVPVTRRLVRKGVPLHIGITFMMAVAIVNPVVLLSTYYAFGGNMHVVILRTVLGLSSALIIGWTVSVLPKKESYLKEISQEHDCGCAHDGCEHTHSRGIKEKCIAIIDHTGLELYAVGRFLILGAFISAMMQTFLPRPFLMTLGQGPVLSVLVMMALAYLLSLCSEADAFIARTFVGYFSTGSIFAFMLFGPLIDVKNTLMLLEGFKAKFVIILIIITFVVAFSFGIAINFFGI